jgi:NAD(P)H-quinone oxidoreductase subunit 5
VDIEGILTKSFYYSERILKIFEFFRRAPIAQAWQIRPIRSQVMEPMLAGFLPLRAVLLVALPALCLVAGLRPGGATADFCFTRARAISTAALLSALLGLLWLTVRGPAIWPGLLLLPLGALGSVRLSVRSDLPSGIVLLLVSFLGWVIVRYSQPYLCGDGGERRYLRWLLVTLGAVALLIITNNLGILLLSWVGVSLALHRLLTFYGERPLALLAARKKFLVSRLAEVFLAAALIAVGATLHTLEIDAVLSRTAQLGELPAGLRAAALCVAISAALKCAQLPVHGWLIQVMEAPTPV